MAMLRRSSRAPYRVAALCSLVWQNRNLSSFSPALNAYLEAIVSCQRRGGYQLRLVPSAISWPDVPELAAAAD